MNAAAPSRRIGAGTLLVGAIVLALLAYFLWPKADTAPAVDAGASAPVTPAAPAAPPQAGVNGVRDLGDGVLVDAEGNRILNEAGLPLGDPLPPAKPVPIKAAPETVVGYVKDANGVSQPLRAKDIRGAANTPGTYAAVDMWADGGPAVVTPTQGRHLTQAQVDQMRDEERLRELKARANPL